MYRRIALTLWGDGIWVAARGITAGTGISAGSRNLDQALRWFSTGSVLRCEKNKPPSPETNDSAKHSEDVQEKAEEQPAKENLFGLIGGMKVEISSKRRFQALKVSKSKGHGAEQVDNLESASSMFQRVSEESSVESKPLSPDLVAAVSAVASSLPLDKKQVESELLQQLRKHEQETDAQRKGESFISDIISDMKIGKQSRSRSLSRHTNEIQFDDDSQGYAMTRGVTQELGGVKRRGLYTGKRLNVFPVVADAEQSSETELTPSLWELELANQIASSCEQPPRNGFEEMIQWTKEGKLWTFPIDNEAGLDEEQKVEFHEHIFLDNYLENFTKQGPIRHFMELVICGLSKNPYLTVQQKRDHIEWFREYFEQKEDILKESDVYLN
ncbi:28S ribosomal protein S31, mitochondrial isoform X2 [Spea bombifrons]|uniref:28S ribosomal protein S31, mitochondrial isoform X2 n=1 Tax=Spea bombifrons TaxID=233779 RepID=UPI00234966F6|nr:28S ribosomal protein S31, mitochondrial isoform X2 [Spea bombifrons]